MVQHAFWRLSGAAAIAGLLAGAPAALAQDHHDHDHDHAEHAEAAASASFSWSTPGIADFVAAISGAWRSTQPVQARSADQAVDAYVFVGPILVEGLSDTIYIESAPADRPGEPFRQTIAQLREAPGGGIRVRTFEIGSEGFRGMLEGVWVLDTPIPLIGDGDLVPTMDITLRRERGGYAGQTDHPYPTRIGGAETMTSAVHLSGDRLVLADRGLDMQGQLVWGAPEGQQGFVFERAKPPVQRQEKDNGLVIIDIGTSGSPRIEGGDTIMAHYAGWTADHGLFDSSYHPGRQPLTAPIPPEGQPGRLIAGWNEGMLGSELDVRRFLIIPGELGYGPQGNPRAGIAPNATLYFAVEPVQINKGASGQVIRQGEPTPPRPEQQGDE